MEENVASHFLREASLWSAHGLSYMFFLIVFAMNLNREIFWESRSSLFNVADFTLNEQILITIDDSRTNTNNHWWLKCLSFIWYDVCCKWVENILQPMSCNTQQARLRTMPCVLKYHLSIICAFTESTLTQQLYSSLLFCFFFFFLSVKIWK